MKNKIEYFFLKLLSYIISRLNFSTARKLAKFLSFIFYYFIPIRKKVVEKNLNIAFPDLCKKEKKILIKKIYQNLFIVLIEILYLPFLTESEIKKLVTIKNREVIENALKRNKGLILVSAHFGNWEILAISAALNLGREFSVIIKPLRNPLVDLYINEWRTKFGNSVFPLGMSIKNIFKELLDKRIVALLADQRASTNSLEMEFFGKKTHVYEGPAVLSIKTGAPIIFAIGIRQSDYTYLVELKEISTTSNKNEKEKIILITQNYITLLEDYIRRYPDQWFWFHNRWKH